MIRGSWLKWGVLSPELRTSPFDRGRIGAPLAERLRAKSQILDNGCWLWLGFTDAGGYGRLSVGSKRDGTNGTASAHRAAWELVNGPVPIGLVLDHLCRNRACINPSHLEPVTQRENTLRGEGNAAKNARKTHCKNGHPFEGDNLYVSPRGKRTCLTCWRARYEAQERGLAPRDRMACPQGHPYDKVKKNGGRICSICHRERAKVYRARKRMAEA